MNNCNPHTTELTMKYGIEANRRRLPKRTEKENQTENVLTRFQTVLNCILDLVTSN